MRDKDELNRFLIENADVRGLLVQLDDTWLEASGRVKYPPEVRHVLGEAFAAAVLLAATIKFDGKMTLQIRGEGAINLLVVQVNADSRIRGLAKWKTLPANNSLHGLFGKDARMIITIEATKTGEPYQGIVELVGESLSDAIQHYLKNSEQLDTQLFLTVQDQSAAGLLLQRLPGISADVDGWDRAVELANTLQSDELIELDAKTLIRRLYHQEDVRLFTPGSVKFECSCSKVRTDGMVLGLGQAEAKSILVEQGQVEVICEFCNAEYHYDSIDIAALFSGTALTEGCNRSSAEHIH